MMNRRLTPTGRMLIVGSLVVAALLSTCTLIFTGW